MTMLMIGVMEGEDGDDDDDGQLLQPGQMFLLSEIRGGRAAVAAYWSDGKLGDEDDYGDGGDEYDDDYGGGGGDGDGGEDEDGVVVSQKKMIDLQIDPWPPILVVHWFPANMVNCIEKW